MAPKTVIRILLCLNPRPGFLQFLTGKGSRIAGHKMHEHFHQYLNPFLPPHQGHLFNAALVLEIESGVVYHGTELHPRKTLINGTEEAAFTVLLDDGFQYWNQDVLVVPIGEFAGYPDSQELALYWIISLLP